MPGVAFPLVGPVGLGSPPSSVLCSAKTAALPISGRFARRSLPDTSPASVRSWCPLRAHARVEAPRPRQGLWSPGPLIRECGQGDRWLSHVPEFPLCMHAPLSDPGGVPHTRQNASGTVACRCVQTVGFPLRTALRDILLSTTIPISGLYHAACILAPSSFVRPLLGWHVAFAPDLLARRSSGGI